MDLSGFNLTGYNYANPRDANYAWLQQVWDYRYADTQTFDEMKFEGMLDATYSLMSGGLYDIARGNVSYTTALGMLPYVGRGASLFTKGARTVTNASRAYHMGSNLTNRIGTGLKHMGSNLRSWGSNLSNVRFTASGASKNYGLGAQYASGLRPGAVRGPSSTIQLTTKQNADILRTNMFREGRPVPRGSAAGHIVASGGKTRQWLPAVQSRKLLDRYRININDAANGIAIGHPRPHNIMHNRAFHQSVLDRLTKVETKMREAGRGHRATRKALRSELRIIGKEILKDL